MDKLCRLISENNYKNDITYYIKQSNIDLISYDNTDNFEIVDYVCNSIHDYFNEYKYDIILDYNKPLITFIYKNYKCDITIRKLYDNSLYWVLSISNIDIISQ
jgi:hypothetical protein